MERQLTAFVERPCRATFMAARSAVLSLAPVPMVATDFATLEQLLAQNEFQAVLDRIDALPASKILSPRVHYFAAEASEALGDFSAVELERSLFVLALQGLLATGDGTPGNPYIVCHASDEHDILAALGREGAGQSLVQQDSRLCDVILCADGREMWFDITEVFAHPPAHEVSSRRPKSRRRLRFSRIPR